MSGIKRFYTEIRSKLAGLNRSKLFNAAQQVGDVFEAATKFNAEPGVLAGGQVAFKALALADQIFQPDDADEFFKNEFRGKIWVQIYSQDVQSLIAKMLAKYVVQKYSTKWTWQSVDVAVVNGITFSWVREQSFTGNIEKYRMLHVLFGEVQQAREAVKSMVWEAAGCDNIIAYKISDSTSLYDDGEQMGVRRDDEYECHESLRATRYAARIQKYIKAGKSRSIMFYGPPGTGKSTLIRTIVAKLKLRTLRVNVEHINNTETIRQLCELFAPDAIIFDDIDRTRTSAALLALLESLRTVVKVMLTSANWTSEFDCATIRPGRVDEIVPIIRLDRVALLKILGESNADLYPVVRNWPIAYIQEACLRRGVETTKAFQRSLQELTKRCEHDTEIFEERDPIGLGTNPKRRQDARKRADETKKKKRAKDSAKKKGETVNHYDDEAHQKARRKFRAQERLQRVKDTARRRSVG